MTAKNIAERFAVYNDDPDSDISIDYYKFNAHEFEIFCEQLCREQREICAKAVNYREIEFANGSMPVIDRETIINAPMPEL